MSKDRYKFLGEKTRVKDFDEALSRVREVWERAGAEGSTGPERTFFVSVEKDLGLVAHCWPVRGKRDEMFLRILDKTKDPIL